MSNLAGESLVKARHESGLDPQTVAARIHITTQQYLALERGEYQRLRGDVFVRGYLRTCAAILNLDTVLLLQLYSQDIGNQNAENTKNEQLDKLKKSSKLNSSPTVSRWLILLICVALFAGFIAKRAAESVPDTVPNETPTVHIDEVSPPVPVAPVLTVEVPPSPVPAADVAPPMVEVPVSTLPDQLAISEQAGSGSRLHIAFNNDCWLKVSDHGKEVFQGVKTRDTPLDITGNPPFEIMIGNVSAVSKLEFNGEAVSIIPEAGKNTLRLLVPADTKSIQP